VMAGGATMGLLMLAMQSISVSTMGIMNLFGEAAISTVLSHSGHMQNCALQS